jgi:hypothetical protein
MPLTGRAEKERSSSSSSGHSHGRLDDWKGPGSGLALVAYRAISVTQSDIAETQMMPLKIRRHRRPMNRRRNRFGNVFANTARAQRRNGCCHGCHRSSQNVVTVTNSRAGPTRRFPRCELGRSCDRVTHGISWARIAHCAVSDG